MYAHYGIIASTSASVASVKKQSIAAIFANPGHYLYGNLIEAVKLVYIEHDYSDFMNKYLRAAIYVFVYSLFIYGVFQLHIKTAAVK